MLTAKPLFTGEFVAFSEFDRLALKSLLPSLKGPKKHILEVGSWLGTGSTRTILEELGDQGSLVCVDHWRGNANVERHQQLVAAFDIFATFRANIAAINGSEIVEPLVMDSEDAAAFLRDREFDLVFLDGDHSYEQTCRDIDAWLPRVAPGGILCGHDCEGRAENFDRDHLWHHRHHDSVECGQRFARIHPGVILAVGERLGRDTRLFAEERLILPDGRQGYSSIWASKNS
jgi:predicted O-methyltransferase YrrM